MTSKGFVCDVELNLHLLSTLGNHECPSQLVFLTVEIFGQVHKTRPQHVYYPLVFNETIRTEKTFWSPSSEDEVLNMLEDSQVVIELRRIDPCFYNGLLLAYYDGSAKDLLFSPYPRIPCSINGREIYFERTVDFKGTAPRMRYSAFTDIKRLGGDVMDYTSGKHSSVYNRNDDGYYSPTPSLKEVTYKSRSRQSRSAKRSYSPTLNENVSAPYYTRQTVASAIRSRSPSPNLNRIGDSFKEKEYNFTGDSGLGSEKSKEPFVVKKVQDSLIGRDPKLHDSLPREGARKGRSRRRASISKPKESKASSLQINSGRRFRSASPVKRIEIEDKLESYKPSTYSSELCSSYHHVPYSCYGCTGRCHSPLSCYSDRLSRLSYCSSSPYRYHSHFCYW